MQNKPNFPRFSIKNKDFTKKQTQFKPNSNPIKANFRPKIRVAKPIQTQFLPSIQAQIASLSGVKPNWPIGLKLT